LTEYHLKITLQAALLDSLILCYNEVMKKLITCVVCNKELSGRQTVFCSAICKNQLHQSYQSQQARGLERKMLLLKQFGGKCSVCGYNKNLAALTFHHIDPKEKRFQLDMRSLSNRKQSHIDEEASKCLLICNNCHAELHNPKHNLE